MIRQEFLKTSIAGEDTEIGDLLQHVIF